MQHAVDDLCRPYIECARWFVGAEHDGVFCELSCKNDTLFFSAGEVTRYVHHSVRESDLVQKVRRPRNLLLGRITDIGEGMHDVLDYAVVTVERKCPLEHYCGAVHNPALHLRVFFSPEIDVRGNKFFAAFRAYAACLTLRTDIRTAVACGDMVDYLSRCRGIVDTADKVHENGLSRSASADNAQDLSFINLKTDVFQDFYPVKLFAKVFNRY